MATNVGIHGFLFVVFVVMLYGTIVGKQVSEVDRALKEEEKVLRDCFNRVKELCKDDEDAEGKVHEVCGLIVNRTSLWGSYSCKPFRFYASGNYYVLSSNALRLKKW